MIKYKLEYAQYTCMILGSFVIHGYCISMCIHDLLSVAQGYLDRECCNPMPPVTASLVGA